MDDKVMKILELQEQGVPRKEIYKIMEYKKLDYLNRFMKRKGFILDGDLYVKGEASNITPVDAPEDAKDNINVISKEDIMAEALSKLIRETREGLIERNDFINEFSKII